MMTVSSKRDLINDASSSSSVSLSPLSPVSRHRAACHENSELMDDEDALRLTFYTLGVCKCRYDGEPDAHRPFLKLTSIAEFRSAYMPASTSRHDARLLTIFANSLCHMDDMLPFNSLLVVLNQHQVVTQSKESQMEDGGSTRLPLMSIGILSEPSSSSSSNNNNSSEHATAHGNDLWSSLLSLTIRHKQFKDYMNPSMMILSMGKQSSLANLTKLAFTLEFTFESGFLSSIVDVDVHGDRTSSSIAAAATKLADVYTTQIEANSMEAVYASVQAEWTAMCHMYALVRELKSWRRWRRALAHHVRVKHVSFKRLVLQYGPHAAYTVHVYWSKEAKAMDIQLGVAGSGDLVNHHQFVINEIKRFFHQLTPVTSPSSSSSSSSSSSIVRLAHILDETWPCVSALAKLNVMPRFYAKPFLVTTVLAYPGFSVLVYSLTHYKLVYLSAYVLDIHVVATTADVISSSSNTQQQQRPLLAVQDGAYSVCDSSVQLVDMQPIGGLVAFLHLFTSSDAHESASNSSMEHAAAATNKQPGSVLMDVDDAGGDQQQRSHQVSFLLQLDCESVP